MRSHILILEGELELVSPALIGSGERRMTDADLLLDNDGNPFIPATSLVGALRHFLNDQIIDSDYKQHADRFWGQIEENNEGGCPSSLACSDLHLIEKRVEEIVTRDGIRINPETGLVSFDNKTGSGGKFDYQVIERGAKFRLKMEVSIQKDISDSTPAPFERILATIRQLLENEEMGLGAKTGTGLGKIKLIKPTIISYDLSIREDVIHWLYGKTDKHDDFKAEPYELNSMVFFLEGEFTLQTSFISRSYSANPEEPDAVSSRSGNSYVLTGSSLRGAIRSRSRKILETIGNIRKTEAILNDLFGYVNTVNDSKKTSRRGRLIVEETLMPEYPSEVQTRIKIDRFTGGTVDGALLEEMPLFSKKDVKDKIKIALKISKCLPHEIGLMILILKDLWTGDLAIGGGKAVGRGVLQGESAKIFLRNNSTPITIDRKGNSVSFSDENEKKLQGYIDSLHKYQLGDNQ